jgi:AraC-like DNA-binding protein
VTRKVLWSVAFGVERPWEWMPRPLRIARELATGPEYRSEGRYRQAEDHCIFHYTLRGEGRVWRDGHQATIRAGEGFLSMIDDPTGGYGHPGDRSAWEFIWFAFSGGHCREIVAEQIERSGSVFRVPPRTPIIQRQLALHRQAGQTLRMDASSAALWVYQLLTALGTTAAVPAATKRDTSRIADVRRSIDSEILAGVSVKRLARTYGLSREHLERTFRQHTGMSLREHIQQRKMAHACHRLKESTLAIIEISALLGYSSPVAFCRAFRLMMGITPMQFRRVGVMPVFAEPL